MVKITCANYGFECEFEISGNNSIPWTEEIIKEFMDKWDWMALSGNINLCWSDSFLKKYWPELYSNNGQTRMFGNPCIKWTENTIKREIKYINYPDIVNFPREIVQMIIDNKLLDENEVTLEVLEDVSSVTKSLTTWDKDGEFSGQFETSYNKKIGDIEETISLYQKEALEKGWPWWGGASLVHNPSSQWTVELLRKYKDKINFGDNAYTSLSGNMGSFWTEEIISEFKDKLNWNQLSGNLFLSWSHKFIETYKDDLDWNEMIDLYQWFPSKDNKKQLYVIFSNLIELPKMVKFLKELKKENVIWSWIDFIKKEDVSKSYYKKARHWKRKPLIEKIKKFSQKDPLNKGLLLDTWIRSWSTKEVIEIFGAVYGPSRMSVRNFIAFLSQIFLSGEKDMIDLLKEADFISLNQILTKNPENLFASLLNVQSVEWKEDLNQYVLDKIDEVKNENLQELYPLLWVCFPKKEFTAPVWDIKPGVSFGPVILGMTEAEVKLVIGSADKIDRAGWAHYFHGHLQLIYNDDKKISQIIIDRFGDWKCLAHGDTLNKIYHFRTKIGDRFPFEEYSNRWRANIIDYMEENYGPGEEDEDFEGDFKYPSYRYWEQGIFITYFNRDYYGFPVTQIDLLSGRKEG